MSDIVLSAAGVSKFYERSVISSVHLQDRLLKWGANRRKVTVHALRDVSLNIEKGEWLGIFGHNGSGKTTLLRVLAGLLQPNTGTVQRTGTFSCFFELGIGFHPERKAEENIYLHGLLQGYSRKEIREMTDDIIRFAGIESHIDLPMKCYSTGMKMRLAYAAAAQVDRDIYLFDEVLAVGDVAFQFACMKHMLALKEKGKTVVLVSHGIDSLEMFCDRIVTIEEGRLMSEVIVALPRKEQVQTNVFRDLQRQMALQRAADSLVAA